MIENLSAERNSIRSIARATVDEASILEEVGVLVVPISKKNIKVQNLIGEMFGLARYRRRIETVNSQLESMGIQRLRARTRGGFEIENHAPLLALAVANGM